MTNNTLETMAQRTQEALDTFQTETQESTEQKEVGEAIDDISNQLNKLKGSLEEKRDIVSNHFKSVIEGLKGLDNQGRIELIYNKVESGNSIEEADIQQTIEALDAIKQNKESLIESEIQTLKQVSKQQLEGLRAEVTQGVEKANNLKEKLLSKAENSSVLGWGLISVGGMVKDIISYLEKKYKGSESSESDGGFFGFDFSFDKISFSIKMTMLSVFAPELYKQLQNYEKFLSGGVNDVVETGKESLSEVVDKENLKERLKQDMLDRFKENTSENIDSDKFSEVFDKRFKKYYPEGKSIAQDKAQKISSAMNDESTVNFMDIGVEMSLFHAKSFLDLLTSLAGAGVISWSDIALNSAKEAGEQVISIGIGGAGIFYDAIQVPLGEMSIEDLRKNVEELGLDSNERMALWGMLYRQGGMFTKLLGTFGSITGYMVSMIMGGEASDSASKFKAFLGGSIWDDFNRNITVVGELEDTLLRGVDTGKYGKFSTQLNSMAKNMKDNTKIYTAAKDSKSLEGFKNALKQFDFESSSYDDIIKNLNSSTYGKFDSSNFKSTVGTYIKNSMNSVGSGLENASSGWKELLSKAKGNRGETNYYRKVSQNVRSQGKIMGNVLENDDVFNKLNKPIHKRYKGWSNVENLRQAEMGKLYLRNIEDVDNFMSDIKTLARQSPEALRVMFSGVPLIAVGAEVMNAIGNKDKGVISSLTKGIGFITPIVGPVMLVRDSLFEGGEYEVDFSQTALGGVLFTADAFYVKSLKNMHGWKKGMGKALLQPAADMGKIAKGLFYDTPKMVGKFGKGGIEIAKKGELEKLLKRLGKMGLKTTTKVGILAGLGLAAREYLDEDELSDSEKETIKKIKNGSNKELEKFVENRWNKLGDTEKKWLLSYAISMDAGVSNENINISFNGDKINIILGKLVNYSTIKDLESDFEEKIKILEGKSKNIEFSINEDELKSKAREFNDKNKFKRYMEELGYIEKDINTFLDIAFENVTMGYKSS